MNAGKCDSCSYNGPLYEFKNDLVEPEVRFNLCPDCMRKAIMCMKFFIQTPYGRERLVKKFSGVQLEGVYVNAAD